MNLRDSLGIVLAGLIVFTGGCKDDEEGQDAGTPSVDQGTSDVSGGDTGVSDASDVADAQEDAVEEATEEPSPPPDVEAEADIISDLVNEDTVDAVAGDVATDSVTDGAGDVGGDTPSDLATEPDAADLVEEDVGPTPPEVSTTTPADLETDVDPTGGEIVIVFSESMNNSLTPTVTFSVHNGTDFVSIPNSYVSTAWATDTVTDDTLIIDSAWIHFPENQTLQWTVAASGLEDLEGTPIAGDVQGQFTTTTRDVTYPAVATMQSSCYYDDSGWTEDDYCDTETYIIDSATHPFGQDGHHTGHLPTPSYVGPTESGGIYVTEDLVTGLQWTSCPLGTTGSDCTGTPSNYTWYDTFDACAALNASTDTTWRVPTIIELQSLITRNPVYDWAIDLTHFAYSSPLNLWTSTGAASVIDEGSSYRVTTGSGRFEHSLETGGGYDQLCVSDGDDNGQPREYIANADDTVSDPMNHLRWLRCNAQSVEPCDGDLVQVNWAEALAYCQHLVFGDENWRGRESWRLPNGSEMRSLFDFSSAPTIDTDYFEVNTTRYAYSTTNRSTDGLNQAAFADGEFMDSATKTSNFIIRCVADYCIPNRNGLPEVDCIDADGDGYGVGTDCLDTDCDDADPYAYPGAAQLETNPELCRRDADGDEFGDNTATGAVVPGTDCDDSDLLTNPIALELPNDGIDNTCMEGSDLVPSNAAGRFVAPTGNDTTGTGDMDAPYLTITHALSQASGSQVVFVAAGDYSESVDATRSIFGGYEATGWTRNIETNTTRIINTYPVELHATGVVVQGFTLQGTVDFNGAGTLLVDNHVLGRVRAPSTGPDGIVVAYNTIEPSAYQGDALRIGVNGLVEGNTIMESPGENIYGYSVRVSDSAFVTVRNNTFTPSSSNVYGRTAIIVSSSGNALVERNLIETGFGQVRSWGVWVQSGTASVIGNLIITGESPQSYPVLVETDQPTVVLNNTLIAGTSASSIGLYLSSDTETLAINNVIIGDSYAIQTWTTTSATLIGNALWGGDGFHLLRVSTGDPIDTCAMLNGCEWSSCVESFANISVAPNFVDEGGGDYHLTSDSEYVDATVNPVLWLDSTVGPDLSGVHRGSGNSWDIGAFEYEE